LDSLLWPAVSVRLPAGSAAIVPFEGRREAVHDHLDVSRRHDERRRQNDVIASLAKKTQLRQAA